MGYVDLNTIHNPTAGVVAPSSWGDQVRDDLEFLVNPPQVSAFHSTTQNASNGVALDCLLDSENYDTEAMHSTSTNTERLTCVTAGKFWIWTVIVWGDSNSTGKRTVRFKVNGSTTHLVVAAPAYTFLVQSGGMTLTLAVNDYVEIQVEQNSGGTRPVTPQEFGARYVAA